MAQIPEKVRDLLDKPITVALATTMPDGQPQVTPVWFDYDGQYVRVNTAQGRQKFRNMKPDSKVTVSIIDPGDAYHWAEIRGHVVEIVGGQEGHDHIDVLSHKYRGRDYENRVTGEVRLMYKIAVDKVNGQ